MSSDTTTLRPGCYIGPVTLDFQEQLQRSLGEVYRIERELGGGGMSRVFLALETALQRKVVVKVLLPELAAGVSVERFRREIFLAAQLQHPHIVPLLSAGESNGLPYFTMPYVEGESLRGRLIREGELPVPQAVRILRDLASALAYAHDQGVVHRDIKPDNVLLSHGVAVVTDFGVAKAVTASAGYNSAAHGPGLTSLGVTLGTPHYMAPEQGTGDPAMDHRVDIYAFGATAYEILTGNPPFTGSSPHAILGAHLAALPRPITTNRPGLPPLLASIVMKCLEKRPADRPQTAGEIMNALDILATPTGGTVPIATLQQQRRAERWRKLAPRLRRYGLPVAAAVVASAVVLAWPRKATTPETPPAAVVPSVEAPPAALPPSAPDTGPAETAAATAPPAPAAREPRRPSPRPEPRVERPRFGEDSQLLGQIRAEAANTRARAVSALVSDSILVRGDSLMRDAESLAAKGRTAEAATRFSAAAAVWGQAIVARTRAPAAEPDSPVPVPAPPPPVAAPVPPRDTTPPRPATATDPAPEIRALFAEYGAAIEARSVEAIRRTYPGLQPTQAREWEKFFEGVSDIDVELEVTDLKVTGDVAEAGLSGVYVFANPSTHRTQREPVSFRATLRREGTRWRITSLR